MKIALLIHLLPGKGGTSRLFLNIAKALQKIGHEVYVYPYHFNKDSCPSELIDGLEIKAINKISDSSRYFVFGYPHPVWLGCEYFVSSRKWLEIIGKETFDVINPHEQIAYRAALNLQKRQRCPVAWYVAEPPSYVTKYGRLYKTSTLFRIANGIFGKYDKKIIRQLDKVMLPNNTLKKLVDRYYGINSEVPRISGVDSSYFIPLNNKDETRKELEKQMQIPNNSNLILSVSSHFWHRKFEDGITAITNLNKKGNDIHYLIVGDSSASKDYTQFLKSYVAKIGATKFVHFLDEYVTDEKLRNLYTACDLFLFPNIDQTWGLAPLEAMAAGKAVIVTAGAGVSEVLEDGKTAFITNARDHKTMSNKLELLLSDNSLRSKIAMQGQKFVRENMTWEKCAQRLVTIFETIIYQKEGDRGWL